MDSFLPSAESGLGTDSALILVRPFLTGDIRLRQIFFDGSAIQPKLSGDLPDEKVHVVQPMGFKHSSLVSFCLCHMAFLVR